MFARSRSKKTAVSDAWVILEKNIDDAITVGSDAELSDSSPEEKIESTVAEASIPSLEMKEVQKVSESPDKVVTPVSPADLSPVSSERSTGGDSLRYRSSAVMFQAGGAAPASAPAAPLEVSDVLSEEEADCLDALFGCFSASCKTRPSW